MKTLLAASLLVLAAASMPAQAQRGNGSPWCLQQKGYGWNGSAPDCSFRSLAQCKDSASGNQGYCMQNPAYDPRSRKRSRNRDDDWD